MPLSSIKMHRLFPLQGARSIPAQLLDYPFIRENRKLTRSKCGSLIIYSEESFFFFNYTSVWNLLRVLVISSHDWLLRTHNSHPHKHTYPPMAAHNNYNSLFHVCHNPTTISSSTDSNYCALLRQISIIYNSVSIIFFYEVLMTEVNRQLLFF